jgi:hypothetical protein
LRAVFGAEMDKLTSMGWKREQCGFSQFSLVEKVDTDSLQICRFLKFSSQMR